MAFLFSLSLINITAFANSPENDSLTKYGPTKKGESLWLIAKKIQKDISLSIEQTVLTLYELNPEAFESGNMNLLEKNNYLQIPNTEQIQKTTTKAAKSIIAQHLHQLELSRVNKRQLRKARVKAKKYQKRVKKIQKALAKYRYRSGQWNRVYRKLVKAKKLRRQSNNRLNKFANH